MKRVLSFVLSAALLLGVAVPGEIKGMAAVQGQKDIIIDNTAIFKSDIVGSWTTGSTRGGKYGDDYMTSMGASGKETSVKWRPELPERGFYNVYYQIPDSDAGAVDIANEAEYEIGYSRGTQERIIDQRGKGGTWNLLGQYPFDNGSDGYVKLSAKKYDKNVHTLADAVRFERVTEIGTKTFAELQQMLKLMPKTQGNYSDDSWEAYEAKREEAGQLDETADAEAVNLTWQELYDAWMALGFDDLNVTDIIIDNLDIAPEDKTGEWNRGTIRNGKYGLDYLSSRTEGSSITWRPDIKQAGVYHVYFQIPDSEATAHDIASDAEYVIDSEKGISRLVIDQRGKGGTWNSMGRYFFQEGNEGSVTLEVNESSSINALADAVRFQYVDSVLDDKNFTLSGEWEEVADQGAHRGTYQKTAGNSADASASFQSADSGSYIVSYELPDGITDFTKTGVLTVGETEFPIEPDRLAGGNELGTVYLKSDETYPVKVQFTGDGTGYLDRIKLQHSLFDLHYEGFFTEESISEWTHSGTTVENQKLLVNNGEAHMERNSWDSVSVETVITVTSLEEGGTFGMVLSGTNNSYLRLVFDKASGKLLLMEDYGDGEPIAVSEGTVEIAPEQEYTILANFAFPFLAVSVNGTEMLRAQYTRSGNLGFFAEKSGIEVDYMGAQSTKGKGNKDGKYQINIDDPRQTIWGLGIEIQSDSIGSGNNGLPDSQVRSVPYGINQEERDRLYSDMLTGFRYLRMAGGLYYRGTDEEGKHLQERWDTQDEELAELIEKSGIEGVDFEFWSPTPYFKASGSYMEPKDNSGLLCFSKDFTGDKQAFLEDFADTVVADLKMLEANGIPVVQFGLQNEAPHNVSTYSHCNYETEEYYETMKVLVPKLRAEFPDIHLHADSWNGQSGAISKRLIQDEELLNEIDGWTWHRIGYSSDNQITSKDHYNANKGRDDIVVYNNEFEYFNGASEWNCINTAQSIMNWMVFEESPTWHWLHALKPFGNSEASGFALGFFHPYDYTEDEKIPKGYEDVEKGEWDYNYLNWNSIRGFLKYMPWNSIRYDVTEDEVRMDQRIMSYQTPEGNQVIALTNRSKDDYFTFQIDTGLDGDNWSGYRYTPTDHDEIQLGTLSGTTISPMLPPLSIEFWVQEGTREVPERGIKMETEEARIAAGESKQLIATVIPEDAPIAGVTWSSSDKEVVTVDKKGIITGISEGTAVVKATRKDGGYFATCMVTVGAESSMDALKQKLVELEEVIKTLPLTPDQYTEEAWETMQGILKDSGEQKDAVDEAYEALSDAIQDTEQSFDVRQEPVTATPSSADRDGTVKASDSSAISRTFAKASPSSAEQADDSDYAALKDDSVDMEILDELMKSMNKLFELVEKAQKIREEDCEEDAWLQLLLSRDGAVQILEQALTEIYEPLTQLDVEEADTKEPEITFIQPSKDMTDEWSETPFLAEFTVKDNREVKEVSYRTTGREPIKGELQVTEEGSYQVTLKQPGRYVLTVEAVDTSGNRTTKAVKVYLKSPDDEPDDKPEERSDSSSGAGIYTAGWVWFEKGWWYRYADGRWAENRWEIVGGQWYHFNAQGYMDSGWFYDTAYNGWFYLEPDGRMSVGWKQIGDKWYYFNPVSDGSRGRMFASTVTPDGYTVGDDGSWVQ